MMHGNGLAMQRWACLEAAPRVTGQGGNVRHQQRATQHRRVSDVFYGRMLGALRPELSTSGMSMPCLCACCFASYQLPHI